MGGVIDREQDGREAEPARGMEPDNVPESDDLSAASAGDAGSLRTGSSAGPESSESPSLNRRRFIGMAAAVGAGTPVLLSGIATRGSAQTSRRSTAPVIVSSLPLASPDRATGDVAKAIREARAAGADVVFVPVATVESYPMAARNLHRLRRHLEHLQAEAMLVRRPEDVQIARDSGRLAVVAHFQGMQMVLEDLSILNEFSAAGVGVMALTHNWKNWNGDGCMERTDIPLTGLGAMVIDALNELGVVIDLSRVGRESSLEAISRSGHPVIFSNSNAAAVHDHPRNLTDSQIDACAEGGGVICVTAFPTFVASGRPSLDDLLAHVDYITSRVGIEHVGFGFGFTDRVTKRFLSDPLPDSPPPFPSGVEGIGALGDLRSTLARRGYDGAAIEALSGGNLLRVLDHVWARS